MIRRIGLGRAMVCLSAAPELQPAECLLEQTRMQKSGQQDIGENTV